MQRTQLGGSIEVSGYIPETHDTTQIWELPDILRYGNVEFGLHLVQKFGNVLQFKQLLSHGEHRKVELLLYVVSGQFK